VYESTVGNATSGPAPLEVRVLGPLELISGDGEVLALPGGKPRLVIAVLALEPERVVSVDRLAHCLWGERPPATAHKVLQSYISRLRKLLPALVLETREPGYILHVHTLDLNRFEQLREEAAAKAAEGRWNAAAGLLTEALAFWRGPPLEDVADELELPGEFARLDELRLSTLEERIEADLALGREAQLVAELRSLTAAYPLRERFRAQLMLVLYRLGRQADALEVYRATRQTLVDELGIDPAVELQELERRILRQDKALVPALLAERSPRIPAALTPLVDRVRERQEIGSFLARQSGRLLTLVGTGGVGKTRLALAVAELQPDSVFVSLAPVLEPQFVRSAIASALGLLDETALADWLCSRETLLVLDNFEHVLAAAPLVNELLTAAPGLRVLVTSRTPLNVSGEQQYTVGTLPESDAVDLFVSRAAAVNAIVGRPEAVEEICRRLDCLPLAIELAAARAKMLPPEQMLARLDERLELLTHGPRDVPERHRTLRATMDSSFALLEPDQQLVFTRLAVFRGGCTLEAAEQVCDATLAALEAIVDLSLVSYEGGRFMMLETIHDYALGRFESSDESEQLSRRLAEYLIAMGETFSAEAEVVGVPSRGELERELDNLRAAIRAALAWPRDPLALRLTSAFLAFWMMTGRVSEGLRWTSEALDHAAYAPESERAECLRAAAQLATFDGDVERGIAFGEQALDLYRAEGNDVRLADVLRWLASAYAQAGNIERTGVLHAESVALAVALGGSLRLTRALRVSAEDRLELGDAAGAIPLIERALSLAREGDHKREIGMTLHSLGDAYLVLGDTASARRSYIESLGQGADSVSPVDAAHSLAGLAATAAREGRVDLAGSLWNAIVRHERDLGGTLIYPHARRRYDAVLEPFGVGGPHVPAEAGAELTLDDATLLALETLADA
jgi:predicted ATPase/DNA-binding SARP family transcriptional activator